MTWTDERWTDERGHEHGLCHFCGADCSTHPDAANPLAPCGDCGTVTCPDHRVEDAADRCNACAAVFYARTAVQNGQVIHVAPDADRDDRVACDRCGRQFQIKHRFCVCRG